MELRIKPTERAVFLGKTGSGKTTLARSLMQQFRRVVVLDPKHMFTSGDWPIVEAFDKNEEKQIIRVQADDYEQSRWDEAIYQAWKMGDRLLYVDEVTLINPSIKLRPMLGRAIRTGRERRLSVWCASQRPKDVPNALFTESEHIFCFRLTWGPDREKVISFTTDKLAAALANVKGHDFIYYGVEREQMAYAQNILQKGGSHG